MWGAEAFVGSHLQSLHNILRVGPLNKEPRIPQEIHCAPSSSGVGLAWGGCFVTGKNSIWDCIYVWDFCSDFCILWFFFCICLGFLHFNWPSSSHYPNQSNRHACLQFGFHYLLGFFRPPHHFFFLEGGVLFNFKINCSSSVTELAIHLGWLHLQFTFRNPRIGMHFTLNFLLDCICTYLSKKLELPHLSLPEGTKNISSD